MESLIPFIIMLLLGSLFSGKKKSSEEDRRSKPFTPESKEQDNPIKKLKEMSKDIYKEIQQEMEQETKKVEHRPVAIPGESLRKVEEQRAEVQKQKTISSDSGRRREARRDKVKRQSKNKQTNVENRDLVPSSSDDIMKGIIFSEIIGPPKSRR
ncbi:hypothetical protein [Sporosarcina pasteurii]|uniref:Uncharacterized protein n=1 Tax=Sporosarcina pasteurii TaxID=1474 RepID=A0A380BPV8_SPOPA|nr:hypothetical protein [Sporosarcina pasteurii]MDS9471026.1 hypothetical protein [Sporosarcina pasteurii]QBQ05327.1 hypothetical protein E2C16_06410 [Sporosarcina pasteurii]SUJ04029.1 Uncharacterised protein [Sporosarcina pasteurii]